MTSDETHYQSLLDRMHQHILPRCYLEIGVRTGGSARLALPGTKAILVDPEPIIRFALPEYHYLEAVTSDEFFARRTEAVGLVAGDIDLAYIDGLHLFEYAMRDFFNVERFSRAESVVILDDCIPPSEAAGLRDRETRAWAGDVWKLLLVLSEIDPSLQVVLLDVEPAGMAVITGLNPQRNLSSADIEALADQFADAEYSSFMGSFGVERELRAPSWGAIKSLMPAPVRNESVERLMRARSARKEGWKRVAAEGGRSAVSKLPTPVRDRVAPILRRLSGQHDAAS